MVAHCSMNGVCWFCYGGALLHECHMFGFAHRKGALHIAASGESEAPQAYGDLIRVQSHRAILLTLRWRTVAAARHMAWRCIWLCLCLCLCRCIIGLGLYLCLCPPLLFCCALLSLFASQLLRTCQVGEEWRGESGQGPQRTERDSSDGGEGTTRGRPCGGGRGGGRRGRPPRDCWGQTTGEWKEGGKGGEGKGLEKQQRRDSTRGWARKESYTGEPMGRAFLGEKALLFRQKIGKPI